MEFWGVEVKNGESLKVTPGENMILHLSQACLGIKQEKESEPVCLTVKFGDQKLGIGILSSEKIPQISFDLVFEKEFELSHNWKNGSVFFTGYRARRSVDEEVAESSDEEDDDIPVSDANGKPESKAKKAVRVEATEAVRTGKMKSTRKDDKANQKNDDGEDEAEASIKRPAESSKKTPAPGKKAKLVTPQKTDGNKGGHVHIATPYPSKQVGKAAATNMVQAKQKTPKYGGDFSCKPCNRSFTTEDGLQDHNRAKHSVK